MAERYFIKNGQPIYLTGINYWPRSTGPLMWRKWRPREIEAELRQMKEMGLNVCRSFLYMPDFMPSPNRLDEVMLSRLDEFAAMCREAGIYTIPTFFVGHMSGENWDVPWRGGWSFYDDPWMLNQETFYVQTVARRLAGNEAILAWLLSNEITNYAGNAKAASGLLWAKTLCQAIREVDPVHPIGIGDGSWESSGSDCGLRLEQLAGVVDFFGPHAYPKDSDWLRHSNLHSFYIKMADYGKPTILEEFGCSTIHASFDHQADYYRTALHTVFLAGGAGALGWCFGDFDLPYQRPYSHHPFELQFGVTTAKGELKPAGRELRRFSNIMKRIDLREMKLPEPEAYIVVPSNLDDWRYPFWGLDTKAVLGSLLEAYVLCKQAHLPVGFYHEPGVDVEGDQIEQFRQTSFPEGAKLLVVPNCQSLTAPTYEALHKFAQEGGTVYYSYHVDLGAQNFEALFGCRHQLRYGLVDLPDDEVSFVFDQDFGGIKEGETLTYRRAGQHRRSSFCPVVPTTAVAVARDGRGNPALLVNPVGRGRVIFCAYPLEYYLWSTPDVHDADRTYRLYHALGELSGVGPLVEVDDPLVEVGWLEGKDEVLIWLVNHAWEGRDCHLSSPLPLGEAVDFETGERAGYRLSLPAKGVRVLRASEVLACEKGEKRGPRSTADYG